MLVQLPTGTWIRSKNVGYLRTTNKYDEGGGPGVQIEFDNGLRTLHLSTSTAEDAVKLRDTVARIINGTPAPEPKSDSWSPKVGDWVAFKDIPPGGHRQEWQVRRLLRPGWVEIRHVSRDGTDTLCETVVENIEPH